MKKLLATIISAILIFANVPAFASPPHQGRGKGVKIGKHFSPHRSAKLKKWAAYEAKRKKKRTFKQYFSMRQEG